MIRIFIILVASFVLIFMINKNETFESNYVKVIDGDTIYLNNKKIRL
jgi:hypothetical protein